MFVDRSEYLDENILQIVYYVKLLQIISTSSTFISRLSAYESYKTLLLLLVLSLSYKISPSLSSFIVQRQSEPR